MATHLADQCATLVYFNDQDNQLDGNDSNNRLTGSAANDSINGMEGNDSAIFTGNYEEYDILSFESELIVVDLVKDRDGVDLLRNVEILEFADRVVVGSEMCGSIDDDGPGIPEGKRTEIFPPSPVLMKAGHARPEAWALVSHWWR